MNTPFTDVAAEHALFNTKARQKIQQTEFMTSAPTFKLCPSDMGLEVAFAGRSNAGKSSAINALTNQRQLARSSKTPGRTQMINFFSIGNTDRRLVDLPGYGYAAVPLEMKKEWQVELEEYLVSRSSLAGLVLMTDIRHPLKFFDEQMLHWAKDGELPVHILLTKADKLKYGASKNALLNTRKRLKKLGLNCRGRHNGGGGCILPPAFVHPSPIELGPKFCAPIFSFLTFPHLARSARPGAHHSLLTDSTPAKLSDLSSI